MTNILEFKEKLKHFYAKYDVYIVPAIKFIIAFVALTIIKENVGYMKQLNNVVIILLISLMCSVLPANSISIFSMIFIILNMSAVSVEAAVVALILMFVMFLLYFRFSPNMGYLLVITPIMFFIKIPYLVPIIVGLLCNFTAIVPISFGVVVYYVLYFVKANSAALSSYSADNIISRVTFILDGIINNKSMLVVIAGFAITVAIVYIIRKLSIDHAWLIAVITGGIVEIIMIIIGDYMFSIEIALAELIIGTVISIILGIFFQFFVFSVDYSRTENVQFEDDDYYYYVKAVPKINVTQTNKKVKKINERNMTEVTDRKKTDIDKREQSKHIRDKK
ncbi:MAG: hypothetical protein UH654_00635 [Lachnospiraceae bacterium]|mgnify:FL=1|nr:hypothetical protein [Lachnospiraceae bacterium]MEE0958524.1 hypothetical protein [Lachnospiraceae bacterium]